MFKHCEGQTPLTLFEAQRALFIHKGWIEPPRISSSSWPEIDQSLCEAYGWTPQQIDRMTVPEIRVACNGKDSWKGLSWREQIEHHIMKDKLTVEERLLAYQIALGQV